VVPRHPEPEDPGSVDLHFQVGLDGGQIARKKTSLVHVAVAIDELMTRYFVRLEALEHPVGRRRRRTGP
jgi:hypothetical protein